MKTYLDIIEDTVEYYFTHNRGTDKIGCKYITSEHDMCAVGRYVKNPQALENISGGLDEICDHMLNPEHDEDVYIYVDDYNTLLRNEILEEEVSHLNNFDFWKTLQQLHDWSYNWIRNNKGGWSLTERGQEKYINLLETDWD